MRVHVDFFFKCLRMHAVLSIGSAILECLHCRFWILILRSCAQFLFLFQINLNVYACLVCGTYYQVRGQKSYSFGSRKPCPHHIVLRSEKVFWWCLAYHVVIIPCHCLCLQLHGVLIMCFGLYIISLCSGSINFFPRFGVISWKSSTYTTILTSCLHHVPEYRVSCQVFDSYPCRSAKEHVEQLDRKKLWSSFRLIPLKLMDPYLFLLLHWYCCKYIDFISLSGMQLDTNFGHCLVLITLLSWKIFRRVWLTSRRLILWMSQSDP